MSAGNESGEVRVGYCYRASKAEREHRNEKSLENEGVAFDWKRFMEGSLLRYCAAEGYWPTTRPRHDPDTYERGFYPESREVATLSEADFVMMRVSGLAVPR